MERFCSNYPVVCTTHKTGVGYPTLVRLLSVQMRRMDRGHVTLMGAVLSGDVAKAFAGKSIMYARGMLAGHDEGGGEV